MERNTMMMNYQNESATNIQLLIDLVTSTLNKPIELLRKYFSACLEKEVSLRQTWLIIQAQVAFILAALPADYSLLLRFVFALWFGWSVLRCKKAAL